MDEQLISQLERSGLGYSMDAMYIAGIETIVDLISLGMNDYGKMGITRPADRRKLFDLIQRFKSQQQPVGGASSGRNNPRGRGSGPIERRGRGGPTTTTGRQQMAPNKPPIKKQSRITVCVRKRPLADWEVQEGLTDSILCEPSLGVIAMLEPKVKLDMTKYIDKHNFVYDCVFDETQNNREVYDLAAKSLVDTVFEGGNAACFAYGQTGSGKTYTMLGKDDAPGLYLMASEDIFARLSPSNEESLVVSFFEIYGAKLFDLLNNRSKLECLEDGHGVINVVGLTKHAVMNTRDLFAEIDRGNAVRAAGSTGMNAESSRSHAILHLRVIQGGTQSKGQFTFIDLAGSERGADTRDCDRDTRMEGAAINKSLLALKECIRALDQGHKHVPFRGSKLTAVLRDCFVGNSRSVMIGNVSPASNACEHTLNTLRYSDRVKELRREGKDRIAAAEAMMGQVPTENVVRLDVMSNAQRGSTPSSSRSATNRSQRQVDLRVGTASDFSIRPCSPNTTATGPTTRGPSLSRQRPRPTGPFKPLTTDATVNKPSPSIVRKNAAQQQPKPPSLDPLFLTKRNQLLNILIREEELTVAAHRTHIDESMEILKQELFALNELDEPSSSIDKYCRSVDRIIATKIDLLERLCVQFESFKRCLKEEAELYDEFHITRPTD